MSSPDAHLGKAKVFCKQEYCENVDEENLCDEGGMRRVITLGTGVSKSCPSQAAVTETSPAGGKFRISSRAHHGMLERQYAPHAPARVSPLKAQLDEAKAASEG